MNRWTTLRLLVAALLVLGLSLGCALYRNDRCFVPDEQYDQARQVFLRTGSLDLTERVLVDSEWRQCAINETMYRLQKEFEVLPEELPRQPQP